MPNKANVSAGKPKITGAIYRAPLGTSLPVTASETLATAFVGMGYVSEDGVVNSSKDSSGVIRAWGGDAVLLTHKDFTDTFKFTMIESLNKDVISAVRGSANVTGNLTDGIAVAVNGNVHEEAVWVIDMILHGNVAERIVIPDGEISDMDDITYKDDDVIAYGVTLTGMPDSSGNPHYEYIKGPSTGTITLDKTTATVAAGSTTTITATTDPAGGSVKWQTDDTDVATVTGGVVTGIAAGTANIQARVLATGAVAYCVVTVTGV